ncbi:MAG: YHYH protein [Nocardioides sp.]
MKLSSSRGIPHVVRRVSLLGAALMLIAGCSTTSATDDATATDADESAAGSTDGSGDTDDLAARSEAIRAAQWSDNVSISIDGSTVTFESDGLPSHEYLDTYLADGRDGKYVAGGVESYDATFSFPVVPTEADSAQDTGNGAIGVAISGAVFFNPYEGDGSGTVANDDNATIDGVPFIDACGGHPLPNSISYHYHGIPFCITDEVDIPGGHSEVIGYLLDGYGIYGPQDVDGEGATDLDECMGHFGPTPDFPDGVYHYHVSSKANYIPECFHGEATINRGRP